MVRARADCSTVILLLGVEHEIMENQELGGREEILTALAEAHRARAKMFRASERDKAADADDQRAAKLEGEAKVLAAAVKQPAAPTELDALKKKVAALQQEAERLKARAEPTRQSGYRAADSSGTIEIVNAWTERVTIVVDGATYSLAAGNSLVMDRAAGEFTYEVRNVQAAVTRTLKAGETFTIRIGPR